MFTIEYAASVANDLAGLTARDRATILDKIEEQLKHEPTRETRNKKEHLWTGAALGSGTTDLGIARWAIPRLLRRKIEREPGGSASDPPQAAA